jgi:hypothetical protein
VSLFSAFLSDTPLAWMFKKSPPSQRKDPRPARFAARTMRGFFSSTRQSRSQIHLIACTFPVQCPALSQS